MNTSSALMRRQETKMKQFLLNLAVVALNSRSPCLPRCYVIRCVLRQLVLQSAHSEITTLSISANFVENNGQSSSPDLL